MQLWNNRRERLQEEIRSHIEMEIEENLRAGMTPEAARQAAQKEFGNTLLAVERSREIWGALWLEYLFQDLRFALRSLRRAPGYMAAVLLTLALGLGSIATMLAVVDSVLLRPIAFTEPQQLVMVGVIDRAGAWGALSLNRIDTLRRDSQSFSAVAGYTTTIKPVDTRDSNRVAICVGITPGLFQMLGVSARMGHLPSEEDATRPVALISYDLWQERLHRNPQVVGSTIHVAREARTVIGVLPRGLQFPLGLSGPVVYLPISLQTEAKTPLFTSGALPIARLKPGVSISQALAETNSLWIHDRNQAEGRHLAMESVTHFVTGDFENPLFALLGGAGILLLIACANAASLQIARSMERLPEMELRSALGASWPRLLQQLLVEGSMVSLAAAAAGSILSLAATAAMRSTYGLRFPRFNELAVRPAVIAAMVLLALAAGLVTSLTPAIATHRKTVAARARRATTPRNRVSHLLVVLQITLTCVLLVTCGLFVRSIRNLQQLPLGFDPNNVTTLVLMPVDSHQSPAAARQTDTLLLDRFKALPGVEAAAMQTAIPFSSYSVGLNGDTDVNGRVFQKGDKALYTVVSSSFVSASGIHLLHGRGFLPEDDSSSAMVALVNQAFVNRFLPGRNPLGVTLRMHSDPSESTPPPLSGTLTVVGVVENELQGQHLDATLEPMIYLDDLQLPQDSAFLSIFSLESQFAIRSPLPQDVLNKEIRTTLQQAAPGMAEVQLQPMEEGIAISLGERRLALRIVSGFGGAALLLAAIGIYGLLTYTVTLRRKEIGVRMALGSSRGRVTVLVLRQALRLIVWGLVPGIAGAWLAEHAVRPFLFGVKALDPVALMASAAVLASTAAIAASFPAWRAARVDPMEVLRIE